MPYGLRRRRSSTRRIRPRRVSMPRSARFTRTSRRRTRKSGPVRTLRTKWKNPIPQNSMYRFKYVDNGFTGSLAIGNVYRYYYRFVGNGCYDPDNTGAGVQPYGFDQVSALFPSGTYRVTGSSITINYAIKGNTGSQIKVFVIPSRQQTLTYTDVSDLRTIPYAKYSLTDKVAGIGRKNWIKSYCSTSKLRRNFSVTDAGWGALFTTNPTLTWFWHVYFDGSDAGEDVIILFDVKIVYYTRVCRVDDVNES